MLQIRKKVFETNSSSTHSFTYDTTGKELTKEEIIERFNKKYSLVYIYCGDLIIKLGEYDWNWETFREPDEKISYILTMLKTNILDNMISDDKYEYMYSFNLKEEIKNKVEKEIINSLKETVTFKEIEKFLRELNLEFDNIIFENLQYSYIDHQSVITEKELLENELNNDVIGFITNLSSSFHTGNDNSSPWDYDEY